MPGTEDEQSPMPETEVPQSSVADADVEPSPVADADIEQSPMPETEVAQSPVADAEVEPSVLPDTEDRLDYVVNQTVFIRGANRPFGEITREDAQFRGAELKATVGWGPTAKVAPIARAWRELSMELQSAGAATVADLPRETVLAFAPKCWVVPPRGTLL